MTDNNIRRRRGAFLSLANMIVSILIGLVYTPFLLRFLGQSEYGIYSLAKSVIAYLSILDLGFGNALVRYGARMRAEGKNDSDLNGMFLIFYMAIACVATLTGLLMMFNIEGFFGTSIPASETRTLRTVYSILLVNTVVAFPSSVFSSVIRSHERFTWLNGLTLINNAVMHGVNLFLLFSGGRSAALAVTSLIFTVITALLNIFFVFKILKVRITFGKFEGKFYKEVFRYTFFIFLNIVVDQLYANTDNIILGKVCSSGAVAVYGVGVTFQQYFTMFSTSVSGVYLSHISGLASKKDGIKQMSDIFLSVGHIQYMLLAFILTGFFSFGQEFLALWAGDGYGDSYYIALIIMTANIIPLSQNIGISVLQALDRHSIRSVMYLGIAVLNVLISIPLASMFGGIGAACGTAIGMLLGQILFMNWFYWKKIGISIPQYWKQVLIISVKLIPVAVLFRLLSIFIAVGGWTGLVLKIGVGIAAALPYCYFAVFNKNEKEYVDGIFKKILRRS